MGEGEHEGPRQHQVAHLTPERAALASWESARFAHPRAVSITVRGNRAEVVIESEPEYRDWVYCVRDDDGWRWVVTGNGPTVGWDDPTQIHWG